MEPFRFDRLVKSLASVDRRRGLLRLLLRGPPAAGLATRREEASGQGVNGAKVGRGGYGGIRSGVCPRRQVGPAAPQAAV
jgi:hypothetical protein